MPFLLLYDHGTCETLCVADLYAGQYCPRIGAAAETPLIVTAEASASTALRFKRDRIGWTGAIECRGEVFLERAKERILV